MNATWSDNYYMRQCPMCAWVYRRNEWEETPPMTHCPDCGIEMERMQCHLCGAPLAMKDSGGYFMFGPTTSSRAPFCGFCGEATAPPRERQYRTKPKPKDEPNYDPWLRSMAFRIVREGK